MTDRSKTHSASRGGRKADRSPVSRKKKLTRKDRIRQIRLRILAAGLLILMILILIFVRYLGLRNGRAVHLSEEVLAYQPVVEQSCKEYGIPSFSQVILAIMQQESAGQVADVMQSSEIVKLKGKFQPILVSRRAAVGFVKTMGKGFHSYLY